MTTLSSKSAYALAAIAGAAGWVLVSDLGGRREAWDSPLYFAWFLPSLCLVVAGISFFAPERPWRWASTPFAAQAVVVFVQNPTANLMPLGLIMFAIFAGVVMVPASIAAAVRRRLDPAPSA
jgi:hypothetical protein